MKPILLVGITIMLSLLVINSSFASFTVTKLNTTVTLNQNTSASVKEILTITISNSSLNQYTADRADLDLTLSTWQSLIGPYLFQHIINPKTGVGNFQFLPGPPVLLITGQEQAQIIMTYTVQNVTTVNQTAPRMFRYSFNPDVFNFVHGASGQILSPNTTLTIIVPSGSKITKVFPVPDLPVNAASSNYTNETQLSWLYQEPLSQFTLDYVVRQSIQNEVLSFFSTAYSDLGIYTYLIIAIIIALFIFYTYYKTIER